MQKPIYLETEELLIHPFRPEELKGFKALSEDLFAIFSDQQTLKFIPGKRLNNPQEAELYLQAAILNTHSGRSYLHFITHKGLDKVIGIIDLISPKLARDHYHIDHYPFFIEFYLSGFASGQTIMTNILPQVIDELTKQGIRKVGAVVNRENIAASKVLKNANFNYKASFDLIQDLYELSSD